MTYASPGRAALCRVPAGKNADLVTDVYDFDLVRQKAVRIATSELQVVDWSSVSPDQGSR